MIDNLGVDIMLTYGIQKGIRGEDLTVMDYLMSANGAMMGTVMHKTFANISDIARLNFHFFQKIRQSFI